MKAYFEVILVFLIIEKFQTNAFITSDSTNIRNLQETESTRNLLHADFTQFINNELLEETNVLDSPNHSTTSLTEITKRSHQSPIEQTLERNYYQEEADNSNSVYVATTENYFNQANNEDSYKPLIFQDSRSTEVPFELLKGTPTNSPSNTANKPPIPELPFGLPNGYSSNSQGSQTPTLIMGGFSILVMPMPGLTPSNMANLFQSGQQLGQASGTNPFLGPFPASG